MDAHLRDLRYFVAVAEELSFTRAAADRLFISQPALSKQIRRLELEFHTPLFVRDRRTVALTPAGSALLPHARRLIEEWKQARRAVAEAASAQEAVLTVGFQTSIGRGLIPAVTATMGRLLPGRRLRFRQVSWTDPTAGLANGDVDVAVAWLPVPDDGFSWKVITREDRWVALPAGHRLAALDVVPFAELADEPFIALPPEARALRDFWLADDHRDVPARVAAVAETADETFEAVASGLGVVLLAAGNAEIYRRDDLVYRPVSGLSPSELAVAWRTGDDREAVRVFAEACCLCTDAATATG
ncbi:LysR substrate-binding domain-containing protein [Actinoallomurus purpureus]|uniref:LysR family transcriptional regulator n=1 Tax=Actinoallomurus purpureus TaxID=478114 RepID=UPI00209362BB|nr:LysR substrate-binding domain-containing protein [Actinoallomurus purpureus]MCO6007478.1 LysR substrate-binding domain-containing protein [Actinoallomurus purpureus]